MLRGNYSARVDEKGRLKIPSAYLSHLKKDGTGDRYFVTSLNGQSARIYPFEEWEDIEKSLKDAAKSNLVRSKFLKVSNYYGKEVKLDKQGRILIPPVLRESAELRGEVDVLGHLDYLEVWNHERFVDDLRKNPLTEADLAALDDLGV